MAHTGILDKKRSNFLLPEYRVKEVLPDYFQESYPKLVNFLEKYYDFETLVDSPSHLLNHLNPLKDVVSVDATLLQYIEDELLLGQSYFQGFPDRRTAAMFAHILYKSKGTKFSVQQFFRMFYNTDADVVYTKQFMFLLNDSASGIGPNSQRFIVDDKLYQTYALLIKIGFATSDWQDLYKLFVHPAGMYLGAEVQIVSDISLAIQSPDALEGAVEPYAIGGLAAAIPTPYTEMTGILSFDSSGSVSQIRTNLVDLQSTIAAYSDSSWTISRLAKQYSNLREITQATSPTFDEDTIGALLGDSSGIDFSNVVETMDQERNYWWSTDSATYLGQIVARDDSSE